MKNTIHKTYILFLLLLIVLLSSCSTKKMVKTSMYSYSNVEFTPNVVESKVANNLSISIEPIDAKDLNREAFDALNRDGGYEKEHTSYYSYITKDRASLSSRERSKLDRLLKQYEVIDRISMGSEMRDML